MSDHFLNKLKSIRERYGIEKSQTNAIKIIPKQVQVAHKKLSINKDVPKYPQKTFFNSTKDRFKNSHQLLKRSESLSKRPVNSQMQNLLQQKQIPYLLHKKSYDRIFRQKNYHHSSKPQGYNNEPQFQSQQLYRSYSLQKQQPLNKYDLIYNYDENPINLPTKNKFPTQSLQRQPLKLSNHNFTGDNFMPNYQIFQKSNIPTGQNRPPSLSYATKRSANQDWTLDNLCKVQQKIQAYLKR